MDKFNRQQPYNDLPLLPPKEDLETKGILLKTISASRALARLNGARGWLAPTPSHLSKEWFVDSSRCWD